MVVAPSRLEEEDADGRILGEAARNDRPTRS
jgi:hypothetical protein